MGQTRLVSFKKNVQGLWSNLSSTGIPCPRLLGMNFQNKWICHSLVFTLSTYSFGVELHTTAHQKVDRLAYQKKKKYSTHLSLIKRNLRRNSHPT
jgi:hypothetical protein